MQLNTQAKMTIGVLALVMAGLPLFAIGAVYNIGSIIFHSNAVSASGRVMNVNASVVDNHQFHGITYQYSICFNVDKQAYDCSTAGSTYYAQGQSVNVLYDPDDLKSCEINDGSREWFFNEFTFIPGIILLTIAGGIILAIKRMM